MILQALVRHYEDLAARGDIAQPGWGPAKVSYALCLDDAGQITDVISTKIEQPRGKKMVLTPRNMDVPAPVKRAVGIAANFLCDNSSYILGTDNKGKPKRSKECFSACQSLHHALLDQVKHPAAKAVLQFFDHWEPDEARNVPAFQGKEEDIFGGANFVFSYAGDYLQEIPALRQAWQKHYDAIGASAALPCLVTGLQAPVARLHPLIKGIAGSQPVGASLVSFNAPAFCSYGHEQGLNAPTSEYAAFAYGAALNHLIADRKHVHYIGDTALLCWAEGGDPAYQGCFGSILCEDYYEEQDYQTFASDLAAGRPFTFDGSLVDPDNPFYVLGIAPNSARLSVRFFLRNTFGQMLRNILEHQKRLEIIRPDFDKRATLSLWSLLNETVNQNSRDKSPSPVLAGELLRAILNNTPYPATLLNGVILRIRADHQVTRGRAAVIKAYYLKHPHPDVPEEVLQVSLNPESTNIAYHLGRLFAVLESIQSAANPNLNATIKDKYFNSASATPAHVFPTLINLSQSHLKVLGREKKGLKISLEKKMEAIIAKLDTAYPTRLTLPQQGSFQLGYYHQKQDNYQSSAKEEN